MLTEVDTIDVNQTARPLRNIWATNVTMNDGMPRRATQKPFATPTQTPTTRNVATPTGMAKALPARRPPSPVIRDAAATLPIAAVEAIDRSMPAINTTNVSPMAKTSSGIIAIRTSSKGPHAHDLRHNRPQPYDVDRREQQHHVF